jgi:predicted transcriptional regulator
VSNSRLAIESDETDSPVYCAVCGRACASANAYARHDNTIHNRRGETPWHDPDVLEELYLERRLSTTQIADELGCSRSTAHGALKEHEIKTRSRGEAGSLSKQKQCRPATFDMDSEGYERWQETYKGTTNSVRVHRLLAVAEYGFEAVCDNIVHHGPSANIPWANWHTNLQIMGWSEHTSHHNSPIPPLDKMRMAEMYRNGDCTQKTIGGMFGIYQSTVSSCVREVRRDE